MARFIVEETENVTVNDLKKILQLHSFQINQMIPFANKLLFIDTNSSITKSYSKYLFGKELETNEEIEQANH
jgi:HTH-type transcriptional repressor of NAD biosynthesis genes